MAASLFTFSYLAMKFEKHILVDDSADQEASTRMVDLIAAQTELSKPAIKQAMTRGAVWLAPKNSRNPRRVRRADKVVKSGEMIHLYYDEQVLQQTTDPAELVADKGDYSIWFKPSGMLCQGSKWGDQCTINRWIEKHHSPQKPAFIVHRLDRAASGLMIIAHKKKTAAYFSGLFKDRAIAKHYRAITLGQFPEKQIFDSEIDGKTAYSEATLIKYDGGLEQSLVNVEIKTGRKHQIRRHLSGAGWPIVGDRLYGSGSNDTENLALRSSFVSFLCPDEKRQKTFSLPDHLHLRLAEHQGHA